MFNPTLILIEAFIGELRTMYERTYGILEPNYPGILNFAAQLALENIATSDAAYHDVDHTIMVTLVGQEILRGRHISVGGVTPHDWLHFIVSLLGHDIGYVRGICRGDGDGSYVINLAGDKVTLPEGATDASMAPYHVARSKLFVRERSANAFIHLDFAQIEANIEHTRFPVPEDEQHESTDDFPGLVRAADLIGQLADINYLRKQTALFDEFRETGMSNKLGYNSVADLRANYPDFFWKKVRPYIGDALRTFESRKRVNSGLPTFTQTYSRWSIEANFLDEVINFPRTCYCAVCDLEILRACSPGSVLRSHKPLPGALHRDKHRVVAYWNRRHLGECHRRTL